MLDQIYLHNYRAVLRSKGDIRLPYMSSSTFRGAFGRALREVACVPQCKSPESCIIGNRCAYYFAFESIKKTADPAVKTYPHPFVLMPPMLTNFIPRQTTFYLDFKLFGKGVDVLPYFIYAIMRMGENGLGRDRVPFEMVDILDMPTGEAIYDIKENVLKNFGMKIVPASLECGNEVTIEFTTPLKLKRQGSYDYNPSFQSVVNATLRRAKLIAKGYCLSEFEIDYPEISEWIDSLETVDQNFDKFLHERYSGRQKRRVPMYGTMGYIRIRGDIGEYSYILDLMNKLHLGGSTAFGFGQVEVRRNLNIF